MNMKKGDRVLILAAHPPGVSLSAIPPGTIGTIVDIRNTEAIVGYLDKVYSFYLSSLELLDAIQTPFLNPEMELSEIEEAELLMEQLKA